MRQKNKQFLKASFLYFIVLTCLVIYVLFVLSGSRERDIPDGLITIYSLVVSTALVMLGKMIDENKDDDSDEDNRDANDYQVPQTPGIK